MSAEGHGHEHDHHHKETFITKYIFSIDHKMIAKQYRPRRKKPNSSGWQVYSLAANSGNSSDPNDRTSKFPLCILQDDRAGQ